jgi:Flp pilus assembly protein TadD
MGEAGSSAADRQEKRGGYATEYLAYLALLVVVVALGVARRDVSDLNAETTVDQQVADGVRALTEEGDPKRAVQLLGQAVKQSPEHFSAHLHLAMALEAVHDDQAAREIWLRVLEMAEVRRDGTMIRMVRGRLEKLERAVPSAALPAPSP